MTHSNNPPGTGDTQAPLAWHDGDMPFSTAFGDHFYCQTDGRLECGHVSLAGNGLPERWETAQGTFRIGELGFGTQVLPVSYADIQDEKVLGTCHLATGRDDHLGGDILPSMFKKHENSTHDDILFAPHKTPNFNINQVRMIRGSQHEVLIENFRTGTAEREPVDLVVSDQQTQRLAQAAVQMEGQAERISERLAEVGLDEYHQRVYDLARQGAQQIARQFEADIAQGRVSLEALFDRQYQALPGTRPARYRTRFDDYTEARNTMLRATSTEMAPWTVVLANDKRRARVNVMRSVLHRLDFEGKDPDRIGAIEATLRPESDA